MPDTLEPREGAEPGFWDRPYTVTNGRTRPSIELDLMSRVSTTGGVSPEGLQREHAQALRLCGRPTTVVEIAGLLKMSVAVTKILLADLISAGAVSARAPQLVTSSNPAMLRKLLDGLRQL